MSIYFDIAYAAVNNRLCFLTGAGFTKAITNQEAPTWEDLLKELCKKCDASGEFEMKLFQTTTTGKCPECDEEHELLIKKPILPLDELAEIIADELAANGLDIYDEIKKIIVPLKLSGKYENIEKFFKEQSFRVVTTNYDKLIMQLCEEGECQTISPGMLIPRLRSKVKVYHVHGSIDAPNNMIVTSNNYFKFMSSESYFSRKLSTLLYENTIVILGYALNDNNLKSIFNNYKEFSKNMTTSSNIILVTRRKVEQHIKELYKNTYNIRVLDGVEIDSFFKKLNGQISKADDCKKSSMRAIQRVMNGDLNRVYKKDYLRSSDSFFEVFSAMTSCGYDFNKKLAQDKFEDIFSKKKSLTGESGAWNQYRDLANWLTYFLMSIDISNFQNKDNFLEIIFHSFETMSEKLSLGYSWDAYSIWKQHWEDILKTNKELISKYMDSKGKSIPFS
ncbi:SIR2 family protein [Acinetobacter baumannii]|uniref:SIR2 family NAD-dependent protein deacylase n=1 Tax=Acinetobacter calcoaceticus/baumannii complex TaxID=909768 RepID=UPI001EEE8E24|nr:SIR2 family protein [Acinetobacter baumannii]MCT9211139.1 SIR2 family protein [Acinetobacter baumannii]HCI7192931.1 SIR2 family protein [Acinetobacter baumannii]